tara:strand:+ start:1552 stop:3831 length:2280 start_codon:yes stop_codon:yes gene_type:complete
MNTKEISIYKAKLQKELSKDNPDWKRVEKLSSTLVDSNESSVRFKVDAGHINKLGYELVGKQETALMELIKNAYDADATIVIVDFIEAEETGGKLIIKDNGSGMSLETVKQTWMNISTNYKKNNKESLLYKRTRAGRKGIGRFAVQRLGKQLKMTTKVKGENKATVVFFDWDEDFKAGRDINEVFSSVEYIDKDVNSFGTLLEILELREGWNKNQLNKVWNGVLALQTPFSYLSSMINKDFDRNEDPGFEIVINKESTNQRHLEMSLGNMFLDHSLADISGSISDEGNAYVEIKSDRLQMNEKISLEKSYKATGMLTFHSKYFIYLSSLMSISIRNAQNTAREYGGIRIYRNGFRVLPYGERSDDWLKLDIDTSRRNLLVPAANTNFFGAVILNDDNENFEEKSNREGLLENEAFSELVDFIRSAIETAVLRIAAVRKRKQKAGQQNFSSEALPIKKPSEIMEGLKEYLENLPKSETTNIDEKSKLIVQKLLVATSEINLYEQKQEEISLAAIQYEEMLRILASLGISLSIFGHEINGAITSLNAAITLMKMRLKKEGASKDILDLAERLYSSSDRVFNIGKYVGHITSNNSSRELKNVNVNAVIRDFFDSFSNHLSKSSISLIMELSNEYIQTILMHESELITVLLNFTTNAIKFLKQSNSNNPCIKISTTKENDYILIRYEDNGIGVLEADRNKIFDAFYTTSIIDDESLEGVGTGLGLKIVSDIASTYGGSIRLGEPTSGFKCAFEFRVLSEEVNI